MRELLGMLQGYHTPAGKESPNFTDVPNSPTIFAYLSMAEK